MTNGFNPKFTITNKITENLTIIERTRGFLEAATLSDDWIEKMSHRAFVLEAHSTIHIEGANLTLDEAELIIKGNDIPEADPDEVKELLNYQLAFDFVSEYLNEGGVITEGLIREINKILLKDVRGSSDKPGEYEEYRITLLTPKQEK